MKRITIKDIAADVGVSYRTVSLALNKKEGISEKMREKVLSSAARLKYRPNIQARGLVQGRSYLIGFACPYVNYSYFSSILAGIEETCTELNYDVILGNTIVGNLEAEASTIERMTDRNIDGIIAIPDPRGYAIYAPLAARNFPLIQVVTYIPGLNAPSILVNNEYGGYLATKHLTDLGHVNIGFINTPDHYYAEIQQRYKGYTKALLELGVSLRTDNLTIECSHLLDVEESAAAAETLIRRNPRLSAIFAPTDHTAIGVIQACHRLGLSVPEDFSVIGYDDMEFAGFMIPQPLTTIGQPKMEMGHRAFHMLERYMGGHKPESYMYTPELIIRKTTKELPGR